ARYSGGFQLGNHTTRATGPSENRWPFCFSGVRKIRSGGPIGSTEGGGVGGKTRNDQLDRRQVRYRCCSPAAPLLLRGGERDRRGQGDLPDVSPPTRVSRASDRARRALGCLGRPVVRQRQGH